jgi:hypothetical protein
MRLAHKDPAAIYETQVQGELDRGWEGRCSGRIVQEEKDE